MKYKEQGAPGKERCTGRARGDDGQSTFGHNEEGSVWECPRKSCEISLDKEEGGQSIKGLSYSG